MSHKARTLGLIAGIILLLSSPVQADVFIDTTATGGDCATYGTWDPSNLTCTLSSDVFDTIHINGDGITLNCAGFTVQPDAVPGIRQGIIVVGFNNVNVQNCIIQNTIHGILLNNAPGGTIAGNTIRDSDPAAMRIDNNSSGVVIQNNHLGPGAQNLIVRLCNDCIVLNNTLDGARLLFAGANNNLAQGNVVTGAAIFISNSDDNMIKNNVIRDAPLFGIIGDATPVNNVIRNNQIFNTTGPAIVFGGSAPGTVIEKNFIDGATLGGISIVSSNSFTINGNIVRNVTNGNGMGIGGGTGHTLTRNDVRFATRGLQISNTATGLSFDNNSFCESALVDIDDGGTTQTWNQTTCDTIVGGGNAVCEKMCGPARGRPDCSRFVGQSP